MATEEKTTHYLVPAPMAHALREMSARTRIQQANYLRRAVASMLARWRGKETLPEWPTLPEGPLVSLVFRLPDEHQEDWKALEKRTRVRRSEWVRLAVHDMLAAEAGN
jgi:predicted DNA-binding protein